MDKKTFERELGDIVSEYDMRNHPFMQAVGAGKASLTHIRQYAINQYEITVRDAAAFTAHAFLKLQGIDRDAAEGMALNFAEEALGIVSKTAAHDKLLFELWERGLGLPLKELTGAIATEEARQSNAMYWRIISIKPHMLGIFGLGEESSVYANKLMAESLVKHYGMTEENVRFFAVHYEADQEHAETGRDIIGRLIQPGDEAEFIAEGRLLLHSYWKAIESVMRA